MGKEVKEFLDMMRTDLAKALEGIPDEKPEDMMKSVSGVKESLDKVLEALNMDSDTPSPIIKAVLETQDAVRIQSEAIQKALDTIDLLTKGTAVRKARDESDEDEDDKVKSKESKADWDTFTKGLIKNGHATLK